MNIWITIGYLAAICGGMALIPEVIKGYRTHRLQDISWGMLFLLLAGSLCWAIYGIHTQDIPLSISAFINLSAESTLILMKKHYSMTGKPLIEHIKKNRSSKKHLQPAMETEILKTENETIN